MIYIAQCTCILVIGLQRLIHVSEQHVTINFLQADILEAPSVLIKELLELRLKLYISV